MLHVSVLHAMLLPVVRGILQRLLWLVVLMLCHGWKRCHSQ
jgi:hypothetical protein